MRTRRLGYSDLHFTTIGIGTWAMGGGNWKFGWGPQDDQSSIAGIHRALDLGINWIDTAAIYGHGHAETVVSKAIKGIRDDVLIATKCSRIWKEGSIEIESSLKSASIRKEVEDSLRRLDIETIDLYQIHWPYPDEDIEEGWTTMSELVHEGKVRYIGVSNFNLDQLQRAQKIFPIVSLQPPYSMLRRDIEEGILDYCTANDIGVIAYSPMQAGLLTGTFSKERISNLPDSDWRTKNPFFQEPQLSVNLNCVEELQSVAKNKGITMAQLSLAWVLRKPNVTSAIVGVRRPGQIEETALASDIDLSHEEQDQIESILAQREHSLNN